MRFRSAASLPALIAWCRALRHGHSAGLTVVRVFRTQAKSGPRELRDEAGRIADRLEGGESLEDALKPEKDRFPPLFRDLAAVGERSGNVAEIFKELESYYSQQLQLRRQFYSQITWPVFQFVAAVLIIALLIWILGMIAEGRDGEPVAPIGFGLTGASGAITFLIAVGVFIGGLFLLYKLFTGGLSRRAAFEAFLLKVPVVGPCALAFALNRFCVGLRMTLETGMSTPRAMRLALRATGNAAFTAHEDAVAASIKGGDEILVALRRCPHFPDEFLETIAVGEESGQIPEVMERQAVYWQEEASRRLKTLTSASAFLVWAGVAVLIAVAIFRIAGTYFQAINQNM